MQERKKFEKNLLEFHNQGGGSCELRLFELDKETLLSMSVDAFTGDCFAVGFLNGFIKLGKSAHRDDIKERPLCGTCNNTFSKDNAPRALAIALPNREDFSMAVMSGICEECYSKSPKEKVLENFGRAIYPDLKVLAQENMPNIKGKA